MASVTSAPQSKHKPMQRKPLPSITSSLTLPPRPCDPSHPTQQASGNTETLGIDPQRCTTDPLYRNYAQASLSGAFSDTFEELKAAQQHCAADTPTTPASEDLASQSPYQGIPKTTLFEHRRYVSSDSVYYGPGAHEANVYLQDVSRSVNRQAYAINKHAKPMSDLLTKYVFKQPGQAIYTQSLADSGFTRPMFKELVDDLEQIRLTTKQDIDMFHVTMTAVMGTFTCGLWCLTLLCMNLRKDTTHAVEPAQQYLHALNVYLRRQHIPVSWHIEQIPYSNYIEVLAYHSPL
ncbi:hypothetical protein LTR32_004646 [Rachicladosporium monterosium]|uniref:Uncharacterized protein n=1 Tax=Rachicladosporium monterosium TaxID=1507873 RepID=A0ABR0L411_9PEZI|nr:hypothetical protein LTR32_004646 [Rachicladosporium monterosium]